MLRLEPTEEGAFTLYHEGLGEIYHSRRGAVQESKHVFINAGLAHLCTQKEQINILEVGFGTGLNALLTLDFLKEHTDKQATYYGLETLEIPRHFWEALSYPTLLGKPEMTSHFETIHETAWDVEVSLLPNFNFCKTLQSVATFATPTQFDLIYFDAFAPKKQPEMWERAIFKRLYDIMNTNASLVTYCAKGQVRRDLQSAGFVVERLKGSAGKFEMIRATKTI